MSFYHYLYIKTLSLIVKNIQTTIKEYERVNLEHIELNGKLERLFKNVERLGKLSRSKAIYYCVVRTKNDIVNSRLKILSVKTNNANIKIQKTFKLFASTREETKVVFYKIDKPNGRLEFYLKWPDNDKAS